MGKYAKIDEFQRVLDKMSEEGWQFKITPLNKTWWEQRTGSAEYFMDELKTIGAVDIIVQWYRIKSISELTRANGEVDRVMFD